MNPREPAKRTTTGCGGSRCFKCWQKYEASEQHAGRAGCLEQIRGLVAAALPANSTSCALYCGSRGEMNELSMQPARCVHMLNVV